MTVEMMEIEYNRARTLLEKGEISGLEEALNIFEDLNDYKESPKLKNMVIEKLNVKKAELEEQKEEKYNRAILLMENKKSAQRLDQAAKLFNDLGDYKDSIKLREECLVYRQKVMKKDKAGIERLRLIGYLFAGIGVIVIAFIVLAVIYNVFGRE